MNISDKINALQVLGKKITNFDDPELKTAINNAYFENNWFSFENIKKAITNIGQWLNKDVLNMWIDQYHINEKPSNKKVGIIMAGNIPLVNLHDVICCFLSGNIAICKLSGKDQILMNHILDLLYSIDPRTKSLIYINEQFNDIDAIIATGSDNSFRYFDYYFGKYPHIFRKNRNSIAILSGDETPEDYKLLGKDIFDYYGLGCRNVSKVFLPKDYKVSTFMDNISSFNHVIENNKYKNNFDYNLSIYLLNREQHWHNDFLIMKECNYIASPCAVLFFEFYENIDALKKKIYKDKDKIQCLVSNDKCLDKAIPYGKTQEPKVSDYPDNIDTMDFLINI